VIEPLALGLQRGDVQREDELLEDHFCVVAKATVQATSDRLELEGEDLNLNQGASALLDRFEN
jgi:hypothetical protein